MDNRITSRAITLNLDGQEYNFRLDFTAMADFEEATGKSFMGLVSEVFGALQNVGTTDLAATLGGLAIQAKDLQALTWACLGGHDAEITLREAGRLIGTGNLQEVIVALSQAIREALPEAKKSEGEQSHPPLSGPVGSPSGASGDSPSA